MESREKQGDEFMSQGDKCVTKSFWRWSEDWEGASVAYEKAATAYKNAKQQEKCKIAYTKAADAQSRVNMLHSAGKNYENAADMAVSLKQSDEAVKLYQNAADMFGDNGNGERSGDSLAKAATALETVNPDAALKLYLQTVDHYESEENGIRKAADTIRKAINLALLHNNLDESLNLLKKQCELLEQSKQKNDLFKAYLSVLIVHLARNDSVAAGKAYDSYLSTEGFTQSKECLVGGQLLDAIDNGSEEAIKGCLNQQVWSFLPNQVNKLARTIATSDIAPRRSGGSGEKEKNTGNSDDDLSGLL